MSGGELTNALLALAGWALAFTIFGTAMIYGALWITDAGKVKAGAESFRAGGAKVGADLRVTNAYETIQTKQFNSQSKPRIKSGREAI